MLAYSASQTVGRQGIPGGALIENFTYYKMHGHKIK